MGIIIFTLYESRTTLNVDVESCVFIKVTMH